MLAKKQTTKSNSNTKTNVWLFICRWIV